jgi:hypothetical protein
MTEARTWLFGLTAGEWLHLAAEGDKSEITPCCGSIGEFREVLNWLATCQETGDSGEPSGLALTAALRVLDLWPAVENGHFDYDPDLGSFPLLKRVLTGCVRLRPDFRKALELANIRTELSESLEQMLAGDTRPALTAEEEEAGDGRAEE